MQNILHISLSSLSVVRQAQHHRPHPVSGIFPSTLLGFTFCAYNYLHIAYVTQYLPGVKFTSPISRYSEWVTIVVLPPQAVSVRTPSGKGIIQKHPTPVIQLQMRNRIPVWLTRREAITLDATYSTNGVVYHNLALSCRPIPQSAA